MAQFYAVIKPSSQAHHRWRMGSQPRGTLHGVPFFWRGGSYVSDAVVEKHLINALMDDPDVEVNMVAVVSYPIVAVTDKREENSMVIEFEYAPLPRILNWDHILLN